MEREEEMGKEGEEREESDTGSGMEGRKETIGKSAELQVQGRGGGRKGRQ